LETKGGAIQQIALADFTRFGDNDLMSADADGNVVLFSNLRILFRASVGHPISSLVITSDTCGYTTLVAGDRSGVVTGFQLHHASTPLWRAQVSSTDVGYKPLSNQDSTDMAIRCLLSVNLHPMNAAKGYAQSDRLSHYLLVAGSTPHLHFYSEGKRVYSLLMPSLINSMCAGKYTDDSDNKPEIALGCENGYIYILKDYAIHKYIQVGHTITHLQILSSSGNISNSHVTNGTLNGNNSYVSINNSQSLHHQVDFLLCTGHFNAIKIYNKSNLIKEISTQDWVHSFAVHGSTREGTLVAGLANNCIQVYKLHLNT